MISTSCNYVVAYALTTSRRRNSAHNLDILSTAAFSNCLAGHLQPHCFTRTFTCNTFTMTFGTCIIYMYVLLVFELHQHTRREPNAGSAKVNIDAYIHGPRCRIKLCIGVVFNQPNACIYHHDSPRVQWQDKYENRDTFGPNAFF